jgi:hypothetical protein
MKRAMNVLILMAVLLFGSGCATQAVWEEGQFARFHQPAKPAHLQVFEAKDGAKILVTYEEETDESARRWRRGYWANLNEEPPENPFRPKFVGRKAVKGLRRVPVGEEALRNNLSIVPINETRGFTLYRDGRKVWDYSLPVYEDRSGQAKQIALTPLAVLADITIVGGYIFVQWASNGGLAGLGML